MHTASGDGLHLDYRLLGRFEVRIDGRLVDLGAPKQRAVLAVLLLEADRVVSTDRLLDLLWGGTPSSLGGLQSYVSNLRRALEPDRRPRDPATVLMTEPPGYRLQVQRAEVDLLRFEDLVTQASRILFDGDTTGALDVVDQALALWTGPPLPELADEPFVVDATRRAEGLRVSGLCVAARARLELGDPLGAVGLLEGPVAHHPLDEQLHGLLAVGLYRCGRQAEALRMVERVRRALADTTGLDIGPELRSLEADLLSQAPQLDWRPPADATAAVRRPAATAVDPPAGLDRPSMPTAFVGRQHELAELEALLDDAAAGRGGLAVVLGEAGIGKTHLVEELAARARGRGFVTTWATCPERGATPSFWSAVQLAAQARDAGTVDVTLVPPSGDRASAPPTLFRLYERVLSGLRSSIHPLLVVVDDLQWADDDSLRLFAHVCSELRTTQVVLVVTVRSAGEELAPALVDALAAFARVPGTLQIHLGGLAPEDVAEWLGRRSHAPVPAALAAAVHARTEGNPLFVKELTELLRDGSSDDDAERAVRSVPPGIQHVVRRRTGVLPALTQELLVHAAVVGRSFELDLVAGIMDQPLDAVLDALVPALDAGMVLDEGATGFRFSHSLVAEALLAELNAVRRARLHAATARELARRAGPRLGPRAALIARHALEGLLAGTGDLAVQASIAAARRATTAFGFAEAAGHWERAVHALEATRPTDHSSRIDALCELAVVQFRSDVVRPAKAAAIAAIELADSADDHAAMVRAGILLGHPHLWPDLAYGEIDQRAIAALERACAVAAPDQVAERAALLGALARELIFTDRQRADPVRMEAIRAARAAGDPAVLARVLLNTTGYFRSTERAGRAELAREVVDLCSEHRLSEDVEIVGWFHLAMTAWDDTEFDVALGHLERCRRLVDRIGGGVLQAQLAWFEGGAAMVRARYDIAERLGAEAAELYRRTRGTDADILELLHDLTMAVDRGGAEPLVDLLRESVTRNAHDRIGAALVAWVLTETGRPDEAARVLAHSDASAPFPDDFTWLCGTTMTLHACVELGRVDDVNTLVARLQHHLGGWSQLGSTSCNGGPVDLAVARGLALLGETAAARDLFRTTVDTLDRLRAPAWTARALSHQGCFLVGTGRPEDLIAGRAALARATELAQRHDLPYVAGRSVASPSDARVST